jgi:hypothetical protein
MILFRQKENPNIIFTKSCRKYSFVWKCLLNKHHWKVNILRCGIFDFFISFIKPQIGTRIWFSSFNKKSLFICKLTCSGDRSLLDKLLVYKSHTLHYTERLHDWKRQRLLQKFFLRKQIKYELLFAIHSFLSTPVGWRINSWILHSASDRVKTAYSGWR